MMTAQEASKVTGLDARIVERPNGDIVDFKPSERLMSVGDGLRCQLGVATEEYFEIVVKDKLTGHRRTEGGWGKVFELKAYGPSFEVAVFRLRAAKVKEPSPMAAEQGANGIAALMKAPTRTRASIVKRIDEMLFVQTPEVPQ